MQEQITCLEQLSTLDEHIRGLEQQLTHDRGSMIVKKQELVRLQEQILADEEKVAQLSKSRMELVTAVKKLASQLDKSREKLSRARNEREVNAATRELEELRRIQSEHEEEIGKLQLVETQTLSSKEEAQTAKKQIAEQIDASERSVSTNIDQCEKQRATLLKQRQALSAKLPRQIFRRYEMIRKRRGNALASTHNGICCACHMSAPPQLFQIIQRNETLEQCPHCQRILYYKPEDKAQE